MTGNLSLKDRLAKRKQQVKHFTRVWEKSYQLISCEINLDAISAAHKLPHFPRFFYYYYYCSYIFIVQSVVFMSLQDVRGLA